MKHIKTFEHFLNEGNDIELNEDMGLSAIILSVIISTIGLKIVANVAKSILGSIGMNAKLSPDKLKEVVERTFSDINKKLETENIIVKDWDEEKQNIFIKIDNKEIVTISDILEYMKNVQLGRYTSRG